MSAAEHRHPMVYRKNGSLSEDYISINVKAWRIAAAFLATLATIVGTIYVTVVWIAAPHLKEVIRSADAPIYELIKIENERMDKHLLDIASKVPMMASADSRLLYIEQEIDKLQERTLGCCEEHAKAAKQ